MSEEDILRKLLCASLAKACTNKVFPVPGGPYNKIPLNGFLAPVNNCGCFCGKINIGGADGVHYLEKCKD